MRLGRDYTNCLVFDYLTDAEKQAVASGKVDISSMSALALVKAKADVERQITLTQELGFRHVELDADVPSPYLTFSDGQKQAIKEAVESNDITLSVHLPYTYVAASTCCSQETDRVPAVELLKRYIEFAAGIGARYVVMHPGTIPPYRTSGIFHDHARDALIKSLIELGLFSTDRGLELCLENNTAFDHIFTGPAECVEVVEKARQAGAEVYLNFDLGHWLTRADVGKEIPDRPESLMEDLPPELLRELHLTDYVPGKRVFHPPLHLGLGSLKYENLKRYAKIVKGKGVEVVVLETALNDLAQVLKRKEFLAAETEFIREIFGV